LQWVGQQCRQLQEDEKNSKKHGNISEYIYHFLLRHAIKLSVVVKSFSPEKRQEQQRIWGGALI
jgi:hypothetical protein